MGFGGESGLRVFVGCPCSGRVRVVGEEERRWRRKVLLKIMDSMDVGRMWEVRMVRRK